jgi:hypothetical protein
MFISNAGLVGIPFLYQTAARTRWLGHNVCIKHIPEMEILRSFHNVYTRKGK